MSPTCDVGRVQIAWLIVGLASLCLFGCEQPKAAEKPKPAAATPLASNWRYIRHADAMTDEVTHFEQLVAPDQKSWIELTCSKSERMFVLHDSDLSLPKAFGNLTARFDEREATSWSVFEDGSNVAAQSNDVVSKKGYKGHDVDLIMISLTEAYFQSMIPTSKRLRIRLTLGSETRDYDFGLTGSAEAIKKLHALCEAGALS